MTQKQLVLLAGVTFLHLFSLGQPKTQLSADSVQINWPDAYLPAKSKYYIYNEIMIAAPTDTVWSILVRAPDWSQWYSGARKVTVVSGQSGRLDSASVFTWKTMGLQFRSYIKEFIPASRLSWESMKKSIQGYHAWLIIPTANGCRVITAESQNGWLTFFEKIFQPKKLYRLHASWLAELKKKAEARMISTSKK